METILLANHTIYIKLPSGKLRSQNNPAVFLNDGELLLKLGLCSERAILFGIVPNDRLSEYTPWPEKAIRPGAPDFGGELEAYHKCLVTEILPELKAAYSLDSSRLAYGGFSLGGLAAVMSLWQTDQFRWLFSVCGSFWYPGVSYFMDQTELHNPDAEVFLLNGNQEGKGHSNRLQNASVYAREIHHLLSERVKVTAVMEEGTHHERQAERFQQAMRWLEQRIVEGMDI